jgi:hypothetical protein
LVGLRSIASHVELEKVSSEFDALDLVERNFIFGPIVKLRGTRRLMCRDLLSVFERAAVLEIGGNPGSAKRSSSSAIQLHPHRSERAAFPHSVPPEVNQINKQPPVEDA